MKRVIRAETDTIDSQFERVASKHIFDFDGFITDYTWYKTDDGLNIFIFGDNDVYDPSNTEPDYETESMQDAQEWFNSYTGYED